MKSLLINHQVIKARLLLASVLLLLGFSNQLHAQTHFFLHDGLGSVVNTTDSNGIVSSRAQFDAWGNKRYENNTTWNRFGFTGHEHDQETDLIYAKARYLDPDTGRFLSQDAWEGDATNAPSLHKYLYAYQNPTVYVDPDGNCAEPITFAVCAAGVVALAATVMDYEFGGQREEAYQEIKPESTVGEIATEAYAFSQAAANTLTFGYHSANKRGGTSGVIEHTKENILPINSTRDAYNEFTSEDGDPVLGTLYGLKAVGQVASLGLAGEGVRVPYRPKTTGVTVSENPRGPSSNLVDESAKARINERVARMKENMTEGERGRTTYGAAEVEKADGTREVWVSAAGKKGYVPPRIRENDKVVLNKSEKATKENRLNDAEQTLMREAEETGVTVKAIGATRDMCVACQNAAKEQDLLDRVVTPLKK